MKKVFFLCCISLLLYACEEIVSVVDISDDLITIVAPTDNAVIDTTSITFTWEELEFVEQYQMQIATPSFMEANQVVLDTILGDSLQSFRNFTTVLSPNNYQWRIRGLNSSYETNYVTQSLEVVHPQIPFSDQMITIISPEDNFETTETAINLSWELIEDATLYRILIIDTSDDSLFLEQTTTDSSLTIDFVSGTYTWSVRAENETQNTPYTTQTISIL